MIDLNKHLEKAAERYERETGYEFRHAFRTRGGELHCAIMPCDLGVSEEEDAENP